MTQGTATVVKNAGSHYLLSEIPLWNPFPALLRGKIRLKGSKITNPVAVGDVVDFIREDGDGPAAITAIHPRRNYVIRRSTNLSRQAHIIAANVDMAYIVVSLYFPELKLPFLDRILVTCGMYGVPVTIVLSKVDLYRDFAAQQINDFHRIYEGAGYRVIETSTLTGEGIDILRSDLAGEAPALPDSAENYFSGRDPKNQFSASPLLRHPSHAGAPADPAPRISLLSGESGVGKSSLIKAIDPALDPKVGMISEAHLQGKHTTSLYEMYHTRDGAFIVDSPGIRGFGLVDAGKEEIAKYFPEMLRVADSCRFVPCTHTHEPGCAVKAALEDGSISPERYNSYLGMLEEDGKFR